MNVGNAMNDYVELDTFVNDSMETCWSLKNGMIHREQNLPAIHADKYRIADLNKDVVDFDREEHFFAFGIHYRSVITPGKKNKYHDGSSLFSYERPKKLEHVPFITAELYLPHKNNRPSTYVLAERVLELLIDHSRPCQIGTLHKAVEFCFPGSELNMRIAQLAENMDALSGSLKNSR